MHAARRVGLVLARVLAVVAHLLLGPAIFVTGLVVHPAIWLAGLLLWVAGFVLIVRWWRRAPGRVLAVPLVLAAAYVAAVVVGDQFGLVGA